MMGEIFIANCSMVTLRLMVNNIVNCLMVSALRANGATF